MREVIFFNFFHFKEVLGDMENFDTENFYTDLKIILFYL